MAGLSILQFSPCLSHTLYLAVFFFYPLPLKENSVFPKSSKYSCLCAIYHLKATEQLIYISSYEEGSHLQKNC